MTTLKQIQHTTMKACNSKTMKHKNETTTGRKFLLRKMWSKSILKIDSGSIVHVALGKRALGDSERQAGSKTHIQKDISATL